MALLVSIFEGCHDNSKPKEGDSYNSPAITSSVKENEAPQLLVNAKDTFYSISAIFSGGDPQYFEDIQSLNGRYKLPELKYPCIEIRNISNKRVVTYHYDRSSFNTFVYEKIKNYWLARFISKGDTCNYYTYQYVLPNEKLSFYYSNKEATWFSDVTVETENREIIYVPEKGFTISPDPSNVPAIKKKYDYKHESILIENGDLEKIQTLRTTKEGVVEINIADCYSKTPKKYSLNWWTNFGWLLNKKADCR